MAVEKNNEVVVDHTFAAPVAKVFEALKAGRLFFNCGAWAEGTAIDFRVGGKYQLHFAHHGATYGEFTEIVENQRIVFTWHSDEMEVKTKVTIDLKSEGSGCKLMLRQEGFTTRELAEMHEGGWTGGLGGLDDETIKHRIRFEREFLTSHEKLYEACAGLKFLSYVGPASADSEIDFRVGGKYKSKLPSGAPVSGEFLEIVKNKKIVFTWDAAVGGASLGKPTKVSIEVGPWGEGGKNSYIELIHEGFTNAESARQHHTGWNKTLGEMYRRLCK